MKTPTPRVECPSIECTGSLLMGFHLIISSSACGPHGMANSVRKAIRSHRPVDILQGGRTVTLHIESFGLVCPYLQLKSVNINMN
jgi:hypothetical protein